MRPLLKFLPLRPAPIYAATAALLAFGLACLALLDHNAAPVAFANNTPQGLPFSQNWSVTTLIQVSDDWTNVPGIVGFSDDLPGTTTGVDPQTILQPFTTTRVMANQGTPDTLTAGGVAEFDRGVVTNTVIALNGSGSADAPNIVIYLNTSGFTNTTVTYNLRDLDSSTDNAVQQVALQYRVGNTGNYTNIPAGYVADATTGPSLATLVTPVNVMLPITANNKPLVELRIMTTNAVGNDEWVGIDDINVTGTAIVQWNSTVSAGAALAAPGIFFEGGDTQVFVGGNGGVKQAYRGSDGSQLWAQNLHGAVQQRGPIVPIDSISNTVGITNVVLVTSQDGYVDALSATNGAAFWSTPLGSVVAGPAFQPNVEGAPGCSTPCNLVFTGTYTDTSPAANNFVALDAENGNIVWTFPNAAPTDGVIPQALGLVTTSPSVDYATNTVYFGTASVTGGGGGGLWALDTRTGLLRPGYPNIAIGNVVNSAPTLSRDGLTLYVGTVSQPGNAVAFHAINAPTGTDRASFPVPAGVGDFRGAPWAWPNGPATDIYSTAGDRVYAFTDTGAPGGLTLKPGFGGANGYAIVLGGGTPLFRFDTGFLYVGGNDGALYKINSTDGTQANRLFLGAVAAVSDPTFDSLLNRFYVTHNGSLYAIGGNLFTPLGR
ncbi:MAG TPA: PQQ-binding-like beta-propeller repeat protein [Chloroflexia bacterium]|nr:PQQ-binding-like beta-propeller repeat protein [Chloroflexia bacterium]